MTDESARIPSTSTSTTTPRKKKSKRDPIAALQDQYQVLTNTYVIALGQSAAGSIGTEEKEITPEVIHQEIEKALRLVDDLPDDEPDAVFQTLVEEDMELSKKLKESKESAEAVLELVKTLRLELSKHLFETN